MLKTASQYFIAEANYRLYNTKMPLERWNNFRNKERLSKLGLQAVLINTLIRRNAALEESGNNRVTFTDKTRLGLTVEYGPTLATQYSEPRDFIRGKAPRFIDIGVFDASSNKFNPYPEVLEPQELTRIEEEARKRLRNGRYNYEDPLVREVRQTQRQVLMNQGVLQSVVSNYNGLPTERKPGPFTYSSLNLDDSSTYHINMIPQHTDTGTFDGRIISLAITGGYYTINGVVFRADPFSIKLGKYKSPDRYSKEFTPDATIISEREFAHIQPLIDQLYEASKKKWNFNMQLVTLGF